MLPLFLGKEVIEKGYKWIFIDTLGNKVFDIKDNFPETEFKDGFAHIRSFDEHWFVNKVGINEFNKTWKDGHGEFKNGIAYVSDKKFSDFYPINTKGERIGTKTFSRVEIYNSRKKDSLETKTKIYRNIILGSYLIIYRIRANRIEILRAFHGSRSPKVIKQVRKVKV